MLKHVQLPKKWCDEGSDTLTNFLVRFDRILNNRRIQCSNEKCEEICRGEEDDQTPLVHIESGLAHTTCYLCRRMFCSDCGVEEMDHCLACNRCFCRDCCTVNYCQGVLRGSNCSESVQPNSCVFCDVVKDCAGCLRPYCPDCSSFFDCQYCNIYEGEEMRYCDGCAHDYLNFCKGEGCIRVNCNEHSENSCDCHSKHGEDVELVRECGEWGCASKYCTDCRAKKCKTEGWDKSCSTCLPQCF